MPRRGTRRVGRATRWRGHGQRSISHQSASVSWVSLRGSSPTSPCDESGRRLHKKKHFAASRRRRGLAAERAEQPSAGVSPNVITFSGGHPEHAGGLLDRQPGEVVKGDQFGGLSIRDGEFLKRFV